LRLVFLKEIPDDANLRRQWNALVMRVDRPQVFYTYEWALAVQSAYGEILHPLLFLAYDEQKTLCAVVALAADGDGSSVTFLCATTADYCDFLSVAEQRHAFVEAVLGELSRLGVKRMAFANLPADSPTASALRQAVRGYGLQCFLRTGYVCAQISLARLERGKDGNPAAPGQKRLRRFAHAVAGEGPLRFDHNRSWEAVAPILPKFIQAHVARFLETGRISNLASARRRVFLTELARLLSETQWLVLSCLAIGDRVVAWHYGFQFHDTWFWYQPTFDSSVEKHWPGFCLLTQVIQDAISQPQMTTVDLGLGSEAYKAKFTNESRETLHVTLHSSMLGHLGTSLRYHVAEEVKARPQIEKLAGALRERFRSLRGRWHREGVKASLAWAAERLLGLAWSRDEILFFEWKSGGSKLTTSGTGLLCTVDLARLADAAMEYANDDATLNYLLRSTKRLRSGGMEGLVLLSDSGTPVHFAWAAPFDGFYASELNTTLHESGDSVLVFDCWTPSAARGHGYYGQAMELIAHRIKSEGKRPWLFSPAENVSSVRGLAKTNFEPRYSLVRQRLLGWERLRSKAPRRDATPRTEVSAQA
jgi:hypothetical protein